MTQNRISLIGVLLAVAAPFGAAAVAPLTASAQTGGVCIPPNVREEVEQCQEGLERRDVRAGTRAPAGGAPEQRAEESSAPSYEIDRQAEARGQAIQARQRALVEQEEIEHRRHQRCHQIARAIGDLAIHQRQQQVERSFERGKLNAINRLVEQVGIGLRSDLRRGRRRMTCCEAVTRVAYS